MKHEELKEIIDLIGYELPSYIKYCEYYDEVGFWKPFHCNNIIYSISVDVREIIFTTEFINKFTKYYGENIVTDDLYETKMLRLLFNHLDDPVSYLYNLLGLGDKNS